MMIAVAIVRFMNSWWRLTPNTMYLAPPTAQPTSR